MDNSFLNGGALDNLPLIPSWTFSDDSLESYISSLDSRDRDAVMERLPEFKNREEVESFVSQLHE